MTGGEMQISDEEIEAVVLEVFKARVEGEASSTAVRRALNALRTPPPSPDSTVRVRAAVAVDEKGFAVAAGGNVDDTNAEKLLSQWSMLERWESGERLRFCWIEANVPLPEPACADPVIEGTVQP
jgi:hypothetical protein